MTTSQHLLSDITRFLEQSGLAETAFGLRAINDGKFVAGLRRGRRVWPETEARVRAFMASHGTALPPAPEPAQ